MPTAAENLTPGASDEQYRQAVQDCIRQLIDEGRDPAQAQAICYRQAETATGRSYPAMTEEAVLPPAGGLLTGASPEVIPQTGTIVRRRKRGRRITAGGVEEF